MDGPIIHLIAALIVGLVLAWWRQGRVDFHTLQGVYCPCLLRPSEPATRAGLLSSPVGDTTSFARPVNNRPIEAVPLNGVSSEAFGLTSGMKPHAEELAIKDCTEKQNEKFEQTIGFYFTPGSKKYPSPPE